MNSSLIFHSGTALLLLGLALMIGGMLALGAFTAPALFKYLPRPEAGVVMTQIFSRYDSMLLVALGLVVLGEGLRLVSTGGIPSWTLLPSLRVGLLVALTGLMLYSTQKLTPTIAQLQQSGQNPTGTAATTETRTEFTQTHKLSEQLYKIELLLAVLLLVLTPFAQRPE
jgi:hypothetical protein